MCVRYVGGMWAGWLQDGVPYHGEKEEEATVQGHVQGVSPDLDGFHSSLPESCSSSLDSDTFPVDAVVGLLGVDCDTSHWVSSSYCLSVFAQADFRCPLAFSHIHL